jgi:hypothetical protein
MFMPVDMNLPILLALWNVLIIAAIAYLIFIQHARRTVPLLSFRNVVLGGMLYFQCFGVFGWLFDRQSNMQWNAYIVDHNFSTSRTYMMMLTLFILCFMIAYRVAHIPSPRRLRILGNSHSRYRLNVLAWQLVFISLVVWGAGRLGSFGVARMLSAGIGTAALGLSGFAVFQARQRELRHLIHVCAIGGLATLPHLTSYGRRGLVSLAAIVVWSGFYSGYIKVRPSSLLKLTALVLPGLLFVAAFSEVRVRRPSSPQEAVSLLLEADVVRGLQRLATFQNSHAVSLWCIEAFPEHYSYRHLYSARAVVHFFVPRSLWKEKPEGLGIMIPSMAGMTNVGGLNVGAGMIGHAMAEGGPYAVAIYAILLAVGMKALDTIVRVNMHPVAHCVAACALGELFAVPRGEVNFFLDNMLIAMVGAFGAYMSIVALRGLSRNTVEPHCVNNQEAGCDTEPVATGQVQCVSR